MKIDFEKLDRKIKERKQVSTSRFLEIMGELLGLRGPHASKRIVLKHL